MPVSASIKMKRADIQERVPTAPGARSRLAMTVREVVTPRRRLRMSASIKMKSADIREPSGVGQEVVFCGAPAFGLRLCGAYAAPQRPAALNAGGGGHRPRHRLRMSASIKMKRADI